jgi:hypothetical protein
MLRLEVRLPASSNIVTVLPGSLTGLGQGLKWRLWAHEALCIAAWQGLQKTCRSLGMHSNKQA